ncbi:MAG TPA: family 10 glycosylhydrolase [Acholeplasma sp.]|nr:family 10 glycosylhydrolase [Acholeplasma sp.]
MKKIRRIIILTFIFTIAFLMLSVDNVDAAQVNLKKVNGDNMLYSHDGTPVLINEPFERFEREFRATWVTPLVGNFPKFTSEVQYKQAFTSLLDNLEVHNYNAIIFHVRIMNDALYETDLSPKSTYYQNFTSFDAIPWMVEESHKRGIEFHAWMNPYRVTNGFNGDYSTLNGADIPANPASDPSKLLVVGGSVILNPGIPAVREYLRNVVEEFIQKYDVDAIHFDDYFYIDGIGTSPDQALDKTQYEAYNPNNLNLADWRRSQVDIFIEELHQLIDNHNITNNKTVQLGISPSGIYRNGNGTVSYDGNGNAITTGSKTSGMQHYGNYLYSDTLKWINEEWIDYILPQAYWGFERAPVAGFADVMSWWNKVVKYKDVNLYAGIGAYMALDGSSNDSWKTNTDNELANQMKYLNTLENNQGFSIYSYTHYMRGLNPNDTKFYRMFQNAHNVSYKYPVLLPEKPINNKINPGYVTNFELNVNESGHKVLSWTKNPLAFTYGIYRSESEFTYSGDELIAVLDQDATSYVDTSSGFDNRYAIVALSRSNTKGEPSLVEPELGPNEYLINYHNINLRSYTKTDLINGFLKDYYFFVNPEESLEEFIGNDYTGTWLNYNLIYRRNSKAINNSSEYFINQDKFNYRWLPLLEYVNLVLRGKESYNFWDDPEFGHLKFKQWITESALGEPYDYTNLELHFVPNSYIKEGKRKYEAGVSRFDLPIPIVDEQYAFLGWYDNPEFIGSSITEIDTTMTGELDFYPKIERYSYTVTLHNNLNDNVNIKYGAKGLVYNPQASEVFGTNFVGWYTDDTYTTEYVPEELNGDLDLYARYEAYVCTLTFMVDGVVDRVIENIAPGTNFSHIRPKSLPEDKIFISWDQDLSCVNSTMTINAILKNSHYNVKYYVLDTMVHKEEVAYNEYPPAIELDNNLLPAGKKFIAWSSEVNRKVVDDTIVNAILEDIVYEIKFVVNGEVVKTENLLYSKFPTVPTVTVEGYYLVEWDSEVVAVTEDKTYTAILAKTSYKYYDEDGKVIKESTTKLEDFKAPEKAWHKFVRWDEEVLDNGDVILKPIYETIFDTKTIVIVVIVGVLLLGTVIGISRKRKKRRK